MSAITVFPARKVITMDPGRPVARAIAVMDGKVLSTGSIEAMQPWLSRNSTMIDRTLEDKVIMPGLIDPHTHFAMSSGFLALPYIGPIDSPGPTGMNPALTTRDAILGRLRRAHHEIPDPTRPLLAWGLDPALQGGHLHRDELDTISNERPIWIFAYAPHFIYCNSAALACSRVSEAVTAPGVRRYDDGRLNGVFVEAEATRLALAGALAELGDQLGRLGSTGIGRIAAVARSAGITTTADMGFGFSDFDAEWAMYAGAVHAPAFPVRIALVPFEGPLHRTHGAGSARYVLDLAAKNSDHLFFHGIKFLADGSFPAMSLRVKFPGYIDGSNGSAGDVPWTELSERMLPFWKAGIQIHCHANGDEAIDAALDALAALQRIQPRFDHRFTIEHYCISSPDQARRLKALGGIASVNNYFVHYRSQLHSEVGYGPDRSEAIARLGSLEREGVVFALHSDFSLVVTPMHPLTAVWVAVNRLALDGTTVMAPGERIGIDRALRAITIDAAYVLGLERTLGSLEPGKLADFAVLDEDPYAVDPVRLKDIAVWGTALSGALQQA